VASKRRKSRAGCSLPYTPGLFEVSLRLSILSDSQVASRNRAGASSSPVHEAKTRAGVAVNVTVVPCVNFAEQLLPQLICVERTAGGRPRHRYQIRRARRQSEIWVNVAVAFTTSFYGHRATQLGPVASVAPAVNTAFEGGFAVKVTSVPAATVVVQVHRN